MRRPHVGLSEEETFRVAVQAFEAGQLARAEVLCRTTLSQQPANASALSLLAMIQHRSGRTENAVGLLRRAIDLRPDYADAHCNLGIVLAGVGRWHESVDAFRRAVTLAPNRPENHTNLGNALWAVGDCEGAISEYRQEVSVNPQRPEPHYRLAVALRTAGKLAEAAQASRQAISLKPDYAEAHRVLAETLDEQGATATAAEVLRKAAVLKPDSPLLYRNLAVALVKLNQFDDAIVAAKKAIALGGNHPGNYTVLGDAFREQGLFEQSVAAYDQAIGCQPDHAVTLSNRLYTMHFQPGRSAMDLRDAARLWATRCADGLLRPAEVVFDNDPSPERRLRIGYVSPDFRRHAAASFLLPLFRHHHRQEFEIICYSNSRQHDEVTREMRELVGGWREVAGVGDGELAGQIRADGIDILVDLALHMAGGRLLTFARKPAPVQVTWLGYPGTTGLTAMDYRLTDPYLDPPGTDELYTEQSLRLPRCFWCYQPPYATPEVSPLPGAIAGGRITFGCLNTFRKISEPILRTWCALLRRVPDTRLLLHGPEGSHRQRVRDLVAAENVDPGRLEFVGRVSPEEYFRLYHRIDVGLDPWPYSGGTTTCDALWMGVPVVSLIGQTAVGRESFSILSNAGFAHWAAQDPAQYVDLAADLARDLDRLCEIRRTLRTRLRQSPLMDAAGFAHDIEAAYRLIWRQRCANSASERASESRGEE